MKTRHLVWDNERSGYVTHTKKKTGQQFVKGPIPTAWLQAAGRLPGKSLHVGVALWQLAGLKSEQANLPLSSERTMLFGVTRQAKSRALAELQLAGLVKVEKRPGKTPLVSILKLCEERLRT